MRASQRAAAVRRTSAVGRPRAASEAGHGWDASFADWIGQRPELPVRQVGECASMHAGAIIGVGPSGQRGSDGPMRNAMTVDAELFGDTLPTYFTRFIGRERECAELADLLRSPGVVTICGVGGVGKTRLAVQVARQLRADTDLRVCWVPLATTLDSSGVVPAVAHGLDLSGIGGGHSSQLAAALGSERAVLVLDNCEQVAAGCRTLLGQLVADCVDLRVITTSRVPLGLSCERIYGVPALGSATDEGGEPTDAMALFVDRAAGVASGYALTELNRPVLAEICRTLQGSPLAIELAASWIRVLSPRDLLTSLVRVDPMVGSDSAGFVEERHRSVEAVLDSSWRWLGETDRAVIEALGVFVGGFTREAAEVVAGADLGNIVPAQPAGLDPAPPRPVRRFPLSGARTRPELRPGPVGTHRPGAAAAPSVLPRPRRYHRRGARYHDRTRVVRSRDRRPREHRRRAGLGPRPRRCRECPTPRRRTGPLLLVLPPLLRASRRTTGGGPGTVGTGFARRGARSSEGSGSPRTTGVRHRSGSKCVPLP